MKLFDDMTNGATAGFQYSGVRPETLGATAYTLVTVVLDITGSLESFSALLLKLEKMVVEACKKSPRSECILLRIIHFNNKVIEIHGFVPLSQINTQSYVEPSCSGLTALIDATYSAIWGTNEYARALSDQEYLANGLIVVVTDGDDNISSTNIRCLKDEMRRGIGDEHLESMRSILIGINATPPLHDKLMQFQLDAGIDQYIDGGDATPSNIAKMANFISQSVSTQSQSLGTGGPSKLLTF